MGRLITQMIHQMNHTRINRSCIINYYNAEYYSILFVSPEFDNYEFHLPIGVYCVNIDNTYYVFHNYISSENYNITLYIKSPTNAYIEMYNGITDTIEKYKIFLYECDDNWEYQTIESLPRSVNNYISLLVVNGQSYVEIADDYCLDDDNEDLSFVYPKDDQQILPIISIMDQDADVSLRQVDVDSIDNIEENYNFIYNLDFTEYSSEYVNEDEIQVDKVIRSLTNIVITTSDSNNENSQQTIIELKHPIRSLPNRCCDTLIIDGEQEICNLIYKVGKKVCIGNDNWIYVSHNDQSVLFKLYDDTVSLSNGYNQYGYNMRCSHFIFRERSTLIANDYKISGISNMDTNDDGNGGFYLRVPLKIIDLNDKVNSLNRWILNELYNKKYFVIEYELQYPIYKKFLIDNYHIKTFYPETYINTINIPITYCYKSILANSIFNGDDYY